MQKESPELVLPAEWQTKNLYVFCDTKNAEKVHIASNPIATIIVYTIGLGESNIAFLTKILQAAQIQLDTHINIIEYDNENGIQISEYMRNNPTKKYWWLGVSPKAAGWQTNWQKYKIYNMDKTQHFISDDLDTIANKQELKRALWQIIQILFPNV